MKLGFTGSSRVVTLSQRHRLLMKLAALHDEQVITEFHHGDCICADAIAHNMACELGIPVVQHPPLNPTARAFCRGGVVLPAKEYLVRNHDIVDATDALLAVPQHDEEQLRSGTWATVRYARRMGKPVHFIFPSVERLLR